MTCTIDATQRTGALLMTQHYMDDLIAQQDLAGEALWAGVGQTIKAFRRGIDELAVEGNLPGALTSFPHGCCGVTSTILGVYLNARYGLGIEQVWADRDGKSHAWLEINGLAIDVTGDQFEGRPPVFFGVRDEWLASWEEDRDLRDVATLALGQPTYADEIDALQQVIQRSGLSKINQ